MITPAIVSHIGCRHDVLPVAQSSRRSSSHSPSGHTLAPACFVQPLSHTQKHIVSRGSESARYICLAQPHENSQITPKPSTSERAATAKSSRQQVLTSCSIVSAAFVAIAAVIRLAAPVTSPYFFKSDRSAVQTLLHSECLLGRMLFLQHDDALSATAT